MFYPSSYTSLKDLVVLTFSLPQGDSDKSFDGFRKKMCVVRHTSQTFLRVALATVVLIIGGLWFNSPAKIVHALSSGSHKMRSRGNRLGFLFCFSFLLFCYFAIKMAGILQKSG